MARFYAVGRVRRSLSRGRFHLKTPHDWEGRLPGRPFCSSRSQTQFGDATPLKQQPSTGFLHPRFKRPGLAVRSPLDQSLPIGESKPVELDEDSNSR